MVSEKLIKDAQGFCIFFLIFLIGMKLIFMKSSILDIFLLSSSLFIMLIIPGYLISDLFLKDEQIGDKIVFGIIFMVGLSGVLGYYVGLIFGDIMYYFVFLLVIMVVLIVNKYFKKLF